MKWYILCVLFIVGSIVGLGLEVAVMGNQSKIVSFVQTGKIDEGLLPFTSNEVYTKILALENNILAELHSYSIVATAQLSDDLPEEQIPISVGLDIEPVIFDPDEDPDNKNEYFLNEVSNCQFHSENNIPNISCMVCLLSNGENVVGRGEYEIDPTIGYVGSSVLEIPINEPPSPDASKEIFNVESVSVEMCVPQNGCTPGYWKQSQHFDSWVTYYPDQSFEEVFGDDSFETLLDALNAKGGQINALGRHAVASLLNSENSDVEFPFSSEQVIDQYNYAIASENFEQVKDIFAIQNEMGCPLN